MAHERGTAAAAGYDAAIIDDPKAKARPCAARMYLKEFHNEVASLREGHPVVEMVEYIEIYTDPTTIVDRPMTDEDRKQRPNQYARFKESSADCSVNGFPLSEVAWLTRSRVAEYKLQRIFAVEDLAGIPDDKLFKFGPTTKEERAKAINWLKIREDESTVMRIVQADVQKEELIKNLTEEVQELRKQIKDHINNGKAKKEGN